MRILNIFYGVTLLLALGLIDASGAFAQGEGENISFFRPIRSNNGVPIDEIVVNAFADVQIRGPSDRDDTRSTGTNLGSTTAFAQDSFEGHTGWATGSAIAYVFPPRDTSGFSPNLAISTSARSLPTGFDDQSTSVFTDADADARIGGINRGIQDLRFLANPGFATPTPANRLATMDVLIHFLVITNDPNSGGAEASGSASGGARAVVGDTSLGVRQMDDGETEKLNPMSVCFSSPETTFQRM